MTDEEQVGGAARGAQDPCGRPASPGRDGRPSELVNLRHHLAPSGTVRMRRSAATRELASCSSTGCATSGSMASSTPALATGRIAYRACGAHELGPDHPQALRLQSISLMRCGLRGQLRTRPATWTPTPLSGSAAVLGARPSAHPHDRRRPGRRPARRGRRPGGAHPPTGTPTKSFREQFGD